MNQSTEVQISLSNVTLFGSLALPNDPKGIVLFAHGSGSSRKSPRNRFVANVLNQHHLGTLLFDLLSQEEEAIDLLTGELRFDIDLLAKRLEETTQWVLENPKIKNLKIGYFGASTGAAAALIAAAKNPSLIKAIVSRGGRPDLALSSLSKIQTPTLLIVGGKDSQVMKLNQEALIKLQSKKKLKIIPGATHLFEEKGALELVAQTGAKWFEENFL